MGRGTPTPASESAAAAAAGGGAGAGAGSGDGSARTRAGAGAGAGALAGSGAGEGAAAPAPGEPSGFACCSPLRVRRTASSAGRPDAAAMARSCGGGQAGDRQGRGYSFHAPATPLPCPARLPAPAHLEQLVRALRLGARDDLARARGAVRAEVQRDARDELVEEGDLGVALLDILGVELRGSEEALGTGEGGGGRRGGMREPVRDRDRGGQPPSAPWGSRASRAPP